MSSPGTRALFAPWLPTALLFAVADLAAARLLRPAVTSFDPLVYLLSVAAGLTLALALWQLSRLLAPAARRALALLVGLTTTATLAVNLLLYREFGEYLTPFMLSFVGNDPLYLRDYLRTYLLTPKALPALLLVAAVTALWAPRRGTPRATPRWPAALALLLLLAAHLVLLNQIRIHGSGRRLTVGTATILALRGYFGQVVAPESLAATRHRMPEPLAPPPPGAPDIVLIVNESWGREGVPRFSAPGSAGTPMPFLASWIDREPGQFFLFPRALSNSGATDLSVPSLLTGVGPHEGSAKMHLMPFAWDWAHAAGLQTVLVSSHRFSWGRFDRFFFVPGPQIHLTGEELGVPPVNDLGVDDVVAARRLGAIIRGLPVDRPLFAIFHSNALHSPCQQTSELLASQPRFPTRRENGYAILDAAFKELHAALESRGRLAQTLVIVTGDHGESATVERRVPRISSFYEEHVGIPLLVRVPAAWEREQPEYLRQLARNAELTVSNLDLVPTIVQAIGAGATPRNAQLLSLLEGRSLLGPIPGERTIIALNTGELRRWDHEGFGLSRGTRRFVYSDVEGARLFDIAADPGQRADLWPRAAPDERRWVLEAIEANRQLRRIYR